MNIYNIYKTKFFLRQLQNSKLCSSAGTRNHGSFQQHYASVSLCPTLTTGHTKRIRLGMTLRRDWFPSSRVSSTPNLEGRNNRKREAGEDSGKGVIERTDRTPSSAFRRGSEFTRSLPTSAARQLNIFLPYTPLHLHFSPSKWNIYPLSTSLQPFFILFPVFSFSFLFCPSFLFYFFSLILIKNTIVGITFHSPTENKKINNTFYIKKLFLYYILKLFIYLYINLLMNFSTDLK